MFQYTVTFITILDGNAFYFSFITRKLMTVEEQNNFRLKLMELIDTTRIAVSKISSTTVYDIPERQELDRIYFSFRTIDKEEKQFLNSRMMLPWIKKDLNNNELLEGLKEAFDIACDSVVIDIKGKVSRYI